MNLPQRVMTTPIISSILSNIESALESLESNTLTIKIDARKVPTRALRERKLQSLNNFCNCDTNRQIMLAKARSRATSASNDVLVEPNGVFTKKPGTERRAERSRRVHTATSSTLGSARLTRKKRQVGEARGKKARQ